MPWEVSVTTHPDNVHAAIAETRKVTEQFVKTGMTATELEEAESAVGAGDAELAVAVFDIFHSRFQSTGGRTSALLNHLIGGRLRCDAAEFETLSTVVYAPKLTAYGVGAGTSPVRELKITAAVPLIVAIRL